MSVWSVGLASCLKYLYLYLSNVYFNNLNAFIYYVVGAAYMVTSTVDDVNILELKKYLFHRMFPNVISYSDSEVQGEQLHIKVRCLESVRVCIWILLNVFMNVF